jgi:prepilin peptidase CpaA
MDAALIVDTGRWLFIGAMIALAVNDVFTYRIPNWANAAIALAFFAFAAAAALAGAEVSWIGHLTAGALVIAVGLLMFQYGALGGGDVKLLSAAALWIGMQGLLSFVVLVGLSGGALVLLLLFMRRNLMALVAWASPRAPQSWPRVFTAGEKVPYGVAIAAGAILIAAHGEYGLFALSQ